MTQKGREREREREREIERGGGEVGAESTERQAHGHIAITFLHDLIRQNASRLIFAQSAMSQFQNDLKTF